MFKLFSKLSGSHWARGDCDKDCNVTIGGLVIAVLILTVSTIGMILVSFYKDSLSDPGSVFLIPFIFLGLSAFLVSVFLGGFGKKCQNCGSRFTDTFSESKKLLKSYNMMGENGHGELVDIKIHCRSCGCSALIGENEFRVVSQS